MEPFKAELARVNAERRRLQKQAYDRDTRLRARRDRALRVGLIAFCHDPAAGSIIATAIMRKYMGLGGFERRRLRCRARESLSR